MKKAKTHKKWYFNSQESCQGRPRGLKRHIMNIQDFRFHRNAMQGHCGLHLLLTSVLFLLNKWARMTLFRVNCYKDLFFSSFKKDSCILFGFSSECACRRVLHMYASMNVTYSIRFHEEHQGTNAVLSLCDVTRTRYWAFVMSLIDNVVLLLGVLC